VNNYNAMNTITAIIRRYNASGFYVGTDIPQKKLKNAAEHYPVPRSENPLALIDATIFGSAKVGMVLGERGVYWRNDWMTETAKNFLGWDELAADGFAVKKKELILAPGCSFDMTGASMKCEQLADMLGEILASLAGLEGPNPAVAPTAAADSQPAPPAPPQQPALTREETIIKAGNELEMATMRFKTIFRLLDREKARPIAEFAMAYFEALHAAIRAGEELELIKHETEMIFELSHHFIEVSHGRQTLRRELLPARPDDSDFVLMLRTLLVAKQELAQEADHNSKVDDFMKW